MTQDFHFVRTVILSCTNTFQIECCHTLITLFRQKYAKEKEVTSMVDDLIVAITEKETSISVDA
jgi:hypothetical protein